MIAWPDRLVTDIARRRVVIVLGSGISRNSKNSVGRSPRTWGEFLYGEVSAMAGYPEYKVALDRCDYLTACELLKMKLSGDEFRSLLINEFLAPKYESSAYHEAVFKLDSSIVASPNFDKIYETYANAEAFSSIRVKNHYDEDLADAIRRDDRLILKIHGTIDTPGDMIFTRREYAEARTKYGAFYKLLEALALTHTFLFLGCGIHDPDIRLILEDIFYRYETNRPHVFVMPGGALTNFERKIVEESMNLSVLEYALVGKDHGDLLASLTDLVAKVETARNHLVLTRNW